jgi:hypothetical protein
MLYSILYMGRHMEMMPHPERFSLGMKKRQDTGRIRTPWKRLDDQLSILVRPQAFNGFAPTNDAKIQSRMLTNK